MDYKEFLTTKKITSKSVGKTINLADVNPMLFDFQKEIVRWSVHKGRAALFADLGLGKTFMQLEWLRLISETRGLIVAPLAVTSQTIKEAAKLGMEVKYIRSSSGLGDGRYFITNYEALENQSRWQIEKFDAVVLDESSILKNFTGSTRNLLVDMFSSTPYRLCCTATPAPNDTQELGNHSEFLGVMSMTHMTSIFFVHDAGVFDPSKAKWRLKRHSQDAYYRWLASWAICITKPSDLGFADGGYDLPPVKYHVHTIKTDYTPEGMLAGFGGGAVSAIDAKRLRRETLTERCQVIADMVNASADQWVIWCGLNDESDLLASLIPDGVNVEGKLKDTEKVARFEQFLSGEKRVLISKISIAGFGLNLQQAHKMVFCGLDYSWEGFYQGVGREVRFGQQHPVDVHIITDTTSAPIWKTIQSKGKEANKMKQQLMMASRQYTLDELRQEYNLNKEYRTDIYHGDHFSLMLGDSCERMAEIPDESVDLSIYSPPFLAYYIYNSTVQDLSNSGSVEEFFHHYDFIIQHNLRITKPGRYCAVHVQDPKTFKNKEGFRGIWDFTGMVINAYCQAGWIYRSSVTIDKNPQVVATRNKDTDLLFVTGKRDSCDLAPATPDRVLLFRKPGDNAIPVKPYDNQEMSENDWIKWAHPIWYDISETDVLNVAVAKGNDDEKHMCPLQLPLIERVIKLYSNPDELIFTPFAGIGSEVYEAVRLRRRGLGIELKPEYWRVACRNCDNAELLRGQMQLF